MTRGRGSLTYTSTSDLFNLFRGSSQAVKKYTREIVCKVKFPVHSIHSNQLSQFCSLVCSQNRTKHIRSCKQDVDYCLIDEDDRPVETDDESMSSYDPSDDEEDDDDDDYDEEEDENVSSAFYSVININFYR